MRHLLYSLAIAFWPQTRLRIYSEHVICISNSVCIIDVFVLNKSCTISTLQVTYRVDIVTTQEYGIDVNSDGQLQLANGTLASRALSLTATDPEPLSPLVNYRLAVLLRYETPPYNTYYHTRYLAS